MKKKLSKYILTHDAFEIDVSKSKGVWAVDRKGKEYLDCDSQYASQALGWNHPKLIAQKDRLVQAAIHKIVNSDMYTPEYLEFVTSFASIAKDFSHFFFIEGGTLGVENALKAAFDWKANILGIGEPYTNKLDVIHLKQAFHGRSGYTLSLTNTVPDKTDLFPKFNWTRITNPALKFPAGVKETQETCKLESESLEQAEKALKTNLVAAIVLEPVQGEGGDNHFSPEYFNHLRKLADKYKAMLILDEVQTGIGMTGKMWAYQHFGIVPDMICFGKKTQVCGFCSTDRIDTADKNVFNTQSRINSTWGGNIVDMVRFTIINEIIKEEKLVDNARKVGKHLLERLQELPLENVRGRGLLIAFDLQDRESRNKFLEKTKKKMTALACGERSIRLRPSLIMNKEEADLVYEALKETIS